MNSVVQDIIDQIMPYNPEKIILFGSYANGKPSSDSDVDLVVIKKTTLPFLERQKQVHLLLRTVTAVDIFVLTPQEFEKAKLDNLFIKEANETGKIVYG
ncbi:MAG: nucleotidyltransferase domain-containing protein [Candidatus Daviesbacteria bacterium]|nr:nucleotidyltransferase domain-containing protein [Candidatus Daviesbacteria bacterium]